MVISAPSARQVNKWHCYHPGLGHLGQVYQVYRVYHLAGWFCRFETNENIRVGTLKRLALLSQASSKFTNQIFKSIKRSRDIMEVHSANRMQDGKNYVVSVGNNLKQSSKAKQSIAVYCAHCGKQSILKHLFQQSTNQHPLLRSEGSFGCGLACFMLRTLIH